MCQSSSELRYVHEEDLLFAIQYCKRSSQVHSVPGKGNRFVLIAQLVVFVCIRKLGPGWLGVIHVSSRKPRTQEARVPQASLGCKSLLRKDVTDPEFETDAERHEKSGVGTHDIREYYLGGKLSLREGDRMPA